VTNRERVKITVGGTTESISETFVVDTGAWRQFLRRNVGFIGSRCRRGVPQIESLENPLPEL
jgi:hypothetical protein